jgi:hypothetical protein
MAAPESCEPARTLAWTECVARRTSFLHFPCAVLLFVDRLQRPVRQNNASHPIRETEASGLLRQGRAERYLAVQVQQGTGCL